eukprot:570600-Amphidinium_carterae.1
MCGWLPEPGATVLDCPTRGGGKGGGARFSDYGSYRARGDSLLADHPILSGGEGMALESQG